MDNTRNIKQDLENRMDALLQEAEQLGYYFGFILTRNEFKEYFSDDDDFYFSLYSQTE